jgi:hypothetical protein
LESWNLLKPPHARKVRLKNPLAPKRLFRRERLRQSVSAAQPRSRRRSS